MANPERDRLTDPTWKTWGPYLAERAWGTVREDYSEHGTAWEFFPHDHARSRVYRWNEDGLAGLCDDQQGLCLAFAFWNGRDPILKERIFGLTGNQGNHGEDAKEHWWFLDSTPTHSFMRWRYHYPQAEFPYADLVAENARRGKLDPEYELLDTGVFDGGHWQIEIDWAKAAPDDVCICLRARNAGPQTATLHVLPTLWFRNTWAWGSGRHVPSLHAEDGRLVAEHYRLGRLELTGSGEPELLFCDNETNAQRLWGVDGPRYPKDGINDHVVHGAASVNPNLIGTKAALHYQLEVAPGETAELRLRLAPGPGDLGDAYDETRRTRLAEADAFYDDLAPKGATADQRMVMRQAFAGMLWSKQFYHYDVEQWLDGDPTQIPPPEARKQGRNHDWRHLNNFDVLSMPDTWEYPWYAAWDLGFHCVALAHVDPTFAKEQLILLCREWYMHPNGQMPAYEWAFGDVNPPVHALAALRVFEIDGKRDFAFLERILHKLMLNFTWWVNRKDAEGNNVFEGGFLGLDNIGPFDRSAILPVHGTLEQSDGTAWMAVYCLALLEIALRLAEQDSTYEDVATKFFEHFALIAAAMNAKEGLWDEEEGFYFDVLRLEGGQSQSVKVHSVVGLIPLFAVTTLGSATLERLPEFASRMRWFLEHKPAYAEVAHVKGLQGNEGRLLSIVAEERLRRLLGRMLDESEFLSPHGLRALSAYHREHPYELQLGGGTSRIDYEPAESTTGLFGGNSNWRGPVWFPINYLMIEALRRYYRYLGDEFTVELPTGSGNQATLADVANELSRRLVSLFVDDEHGRRPVFGGTERLQSDPEWHDLVPFHEYFHGDNGAGLGASHQTGWTGLVADLIVDAGLDRALSRRLASSG